MCFGLLNYLLSGATTHPAFGHYNISNWYSNDISRRLKVLQVPLSIAHFNPASLAAEIDLLQSVQAGNAIQRNYRFLARRMLKHLDSLKIAEYFKDKKEINILSIGCGFAFDFIPLDVYFSYNWSSIRYTGVDINSHSINAAQTAFSQFKNTSFIHSDIRNLENNSAYDLIIIQHPNFLQNADIFKQILQDNVLPHLAPNGHLYISFYYESEWNQFNSQILPVWQPTLGHLKIQNQERGSLEDRNTGESYAPEKFVYFSPKPYQPDVNQIMSPQQDFAPLHRRAPR